MPAVREDSVESSEPGIALGAYAGGVAISDVPVSAAVFTGPDHAVSAVAAGLGHQPPEAPPRVEETAGPAAESDATPA
jgi:hypothetical protein